MTKDKEHNFLFYQRWYDQLSRLPDAERLEIYEAICRYAFHHEQSSLVYYLESIMDNIRATIDENEQRQQRFIELQKEKSCKGVEARKQKRDNEQALTSGNPTQPTGNPRVTSGNPTQPYNKNKKNNKNNTSTPSNEVVDDNKENLSLKERQKKSATAVAPLSHEEEQKRMKKRKKRFYESLIPYVSLYGKETIRAFYDYWSEPNKSHTKFRMELERTWDVSRRLRTWIKREQAYEQRTHPSSLQQPTRAQRDASFIQHIQEKLSHPDDDETTILPWEVPNTPTTPT